MKVKFSIVITPDNSRHTTLFPKLQTFSLQGLSNYLFF